MDASVPVSMVPIHQTMNKSSSGELFFLSITSPIIGLHELGVPTANKLEENRASKQGERVRAKPLELEKWREKIDRATI